jgi:hypothetical protein
MSNIAGELTCPSCGTDFPDGLCPACEDIADEMADRCPSCGIIFPDGLCPGCEDIAAEEAVANAEEEGFGECGDCPAILSFDEWDRGGLCEECEILREDLDD